MTPQVPSSSLSRNGVVIGALMMREIVTRYGREGLGFLWLVAEPLLFCLFVLVMWSFIKPAYEHGIRLGAFVMTGYMSMLLIRHVMSTCLAAVQANVGLLYHRQVSILHIYAARILLEILGTSIAFVAVYVLLFAFGQVEPPHDMLKLLGGWTILAVQSSGLAIIIAALALRFDTVERIAPLIQYGLIPVSGAFVMAAWVPQEFREVLLTVPFPHAVEMVRAGVFGEFVATYYDIPYALYWALGLNLVGLLLLAKAKYYLEVE